VDFEGPLVPAKLARERAEVVEALKGSKRLFTLWLGGIRGSFVALLT
jgi:hypothetical protein